MLAEIDHLSSREQIFVIRYSDIDSVNEKILQYSSPDKKSKWTR